MLKKRFLFADCGLCQTACCLQLNAATSCIAMLATIKSAKAAAISKTNLRSCQNTELAGAFASHKNVCIAINRKLCEWQFAELGNAVTYADR